MVQCPLLTNERGAVLVTGLLILIILSIFGMTTMQSTLLQEKMAGNLEQQDVAFQAAESGLRLAEAQMFSYVILPSFTGANGLYQPETAGTTPRWETVDWTNATEYIEYQAADLTATPPTPEIRCIVEYLAEVDDDGSDSVKFTASTANRDMLRITSRGVSPNGRSVVMLQTTYLR